MSAWRYSRGHSLGNGLAAIIWIIAVVAAFFLILHIIFVIFEANPGNALVDFVGDVANALAWIFRDLFTPDDGKLRVLLNFGLAAIVYLALGRVVARAID
jgi:hypothetical protein